MVFKRKKTEAGGVVFVRPRGMGGAVAVLDPRNGHVVSLEPGRAYPANHALVQAHPWLFLTPEEHLAAQQGTFTEASSVRVDGADDIKDMARKFAEADAEALRRLAEMTPEERQAAEADQALAPYGMRFEDTDAGPAVRMPAVDDDHVARSMRMFTRTDHTWVALFGLVEGSRLCQADRSERAKALAVRGVLKPAEVAHLRYMATAERPFDSVDVDTEPLSVEAARESLPYLPSVEVDNGREYGEAWHQGAKSGTNTVVSGWDSPSTGPSAPTPPGRVWGDGTGVTVADEAIPRARGAKVAASRRKFAEGWS